MAGPDLVAARATAESVMDATCVITRDPEGTQDDWIDYDDGTVGPGPDDASQVYDGPCMVRPEDMSRSAEDQGEAAIWEQLYRVRIPVSAPVVLRGDVVTLTACPSDPQVIGRALTATRIDEGTYAITRIIRCVAQARGPEL